MAAPTETEWEVGATWPFGTESAIDPRWYKGSAYDGCVALFLSWDTTILSRWAGGGFVITS